MFSIIGLLTGLAGPLANAFSQVEALQAAKLKASTDSEKQQLDAQLGEAHGRVMVLQSEAGSRINAIIRGGFAFGPMVYLNKNFIWDKVIGSFLGYSKSGSMFDTDGLDVNLWQVVTAILAFYFVYDLAASWRKPR